MEMGTTLFNRVNPLRAKIVVDMKELDRYSYCGHSTLIGKEKRQWQDVEYVWTVVELGMPMVDLARKFDITPTAVSYAVQRGEKMEKERGYQLET